MSKTWLPIHWKHGSTTPVLTSITLSGPSSLVATQAATYTATGYDQNGHAMSGLTFAFHSSLVGVATINSGSGLATGVTAGATTLTATSGSVTSSPFTLSVAAQVPTTLSVAPSAFTLAATGATQALVATALDQVGAPITSPTVSWISSAPSIATVSSSGVVTGVGTGAVTIAATDGSATGSASGTATGTIVASPSLDPTNATTGAGILQSNGALPFWFDYPRRYSGTGYASPDAQWRATAVNSGISTYANPALAGGLTGAGAWVPYTNTGTRYGDGSFVDLMQLTPAPDPAYGPAFQEPCWEATIVGNNLPSSAPCCSIRPASSVHPYSIIIARRMAYCATPPFTAVGDADNTSCAATFNAGGSCGGVNYAFQNPSWKSGPFGSYLGSGRGGQETGNWNATAGQLFLLNLPPNPPNTSGGFSETAWSGGTSDAAWQNGAPLWEAIVLEQWQRSTDSTYWVAATRFIRLDADPHWTQSSPRMVSQVTGIVGFYEFDVIPGSKNYNQSRNTHLKTWHMQGALWDMSDPNHDGSNDPLGFLAYVAGLTPATPASISVTSSSASAVSVRVPVSQYMGRVRLAIDGSVLVGQDYVLTREDGEKIVTGGALQATYVTVAVSGLSLASGSHTVTAYAVNKNNTIRDPTGVSTTVTV